MSHIYRNPVGLLCLTVLLNLCFPFVGAQATTETQKITGLRESVEILTDRWGIAHIYAKNQGDLFFAQGYVAARDRLFQLEVWRRRVTGTMAEIQGRKALDRDIGARLLRPRLELRREMNHYHPQGEQIITAFVNGINAYIEQTERRPGLLPIEFRLLGITPQPWTAEIVVARLDGIFLNVEKEVQHAAVTSVVGAEMTRQLFNMHPGEPSLIADESIDLSAIPPDLTKYYKAARQPVKFQPEDIVEQKARAAASLDTPASAAIVGQTQGILENQEGSNNWVISGERTSSGHPFMANDPHRAITAPSLRYWVHLVAPGWNVIGGGEPRLPGVSIGHNEYGAWGLTVFLTDSEDLYVYETHPDDPNRYKYDGEWVDMEVYQEAFAVKGESHVTVALKYTRHGPVLAEYPDRHRAYALRAAWLEIGGAPYLASLRMDQARNWEEFRAACAFSHAPSENMVWAGMDGDIGWQAVGIVPLRPNWNGLLPVPGDGRYEWKGYLPAQELPHRKNPTEGFLATANQENLPPHYPHPISYFWIEPHRFARIHEILRGAEHFTMNSMVALQNDELSIPARMLVPLLRNQRSKIPAVQAANERLLEWDFVLSKDSVAAGIYAAWQAQLWNNFLAEEVPEIVHSHFPEIVLQPLLDRLFAADSGDERRRGALDDRFALQALEQAVDSLIERFGPDASTWIYGQVQYHHILMRHPLSDAVNTEYLKRFEVGPIARGGDAYTVNNTANNALQTLGASFRIIADLSDWDRSLGINAPGQSGDPDDPHYRDLAQDWAAGRYFPVLYSREKVEAASEQKTLLTP